jgi:AraC-like DNA-binding protein
LRQRLQGGKVLRIPAATARRKSESLAATYFNISRAGTADSRVSVAVESWEETLFCELLQSIRVRRSVCFRPTFAAPWAFRFKGTVTYFHFVASGTCWLDVRSGCGPVQLGAGDFVVLPRGRPHLMSHLPGTRPTDFFELLRLHAVDRSGALRAGGTGPSTGLVCGGMQFDNGAADALLAALPPLIHVKPQGGTAPRWLEGTICHLLEELDAERVCRQPVITRLADILFIQAIRAYLNEHAGRVQSGGWLAALQDRRVGQALALLHSQPGERWTVGGLAGRLALSRSAFAARFSHLLGESPHRYLARLRLNVASERLRNTDDKISVIAASAGYRSLAAFSRAFKHEQGVSPVEYRRNPVTQTREYA